MIELLVVMGVIVLLIALALPAFSFITGSRSTESAGNQIAAALGVARAQAIGLQKYCGIMFFIEPTSDRVQIALVQQAERPSGIGDNDVTDVDVYLDLSPDAEFVKLPAGVGVQTVTNGLYTGGGATNFSTNDRYIGFNTTGMTGSKVDRTDLITQIGGVILFDANGQLATKSYALRSRINNSTTPTGSTMGALLFYNNDPDQAVANAAATIPDYLPVSTTFFGLNPANLPDSQIGFVLFDANVFSSQQFTPSDPRTIRGVSAGIDANEEAWFDENATPVMINRYNGTLVRGG